MSRPKVILTPGEVLRCVVNTLLKGVAKRLPEASLDWKIDGSMYSVSHDAEKMPFGKIQVIDVKNSGVLIRFFIQDLDCRVLILDVSKRSLTVDQLRELANAIARVTKSVLPQEVLESFCLRPLAPLQENPVVKKSWEGDVSKLPNWSDIQKNPELLLRILRKFASLTQEEVTTLKPGNVIALALGGTYTRYMRVTSNLDRLGYFERMKGNAQSILSAAGRAKLSELEQSFSGKADEQE